MGYSVLFGVPTTIQRRKLVQAASWELGLLSYHLESCHMQGCLWWLLKQGSGGLLTFRYLSFLLKGTVSLKSQPVTSRAAELKDEHDKGDLWG